MLSTAASYSLFTEEEEQGVDDVASFVSQAFSQGSLCGSARGSGRDTVRPAVRMALARPGLDEAPVSSAPVNAFFPHYIAELHRCWPDSRALSHYTSDSRVLATTANADTCGLDRFAPIEPAIASLVVSQDEALRADVRCPRPKCRITDDLLKRSYNIAAHVGRLGNSLSHIFLALSQTIRGSGADHSAQTLSNASLQTFAYMTRELGRLMSTVMLARRQVWLAQSPLSDMCRRTLHSLPVIPGQTFGPAALLALEQSVQVGQASQQFASLRRAPLLHSRPGASAVPRANSSQPRSGGQSRGQHFSAQVDQGVSTAPRVAFQAPRGPAPSRCPPRAPRGKGGRY
jgi:hypothetical protein